MTAKKDSRVRRLGKHQKRILTALAKRDRIQIRRSIAENETSLMRILRSLAPIIVEPDDTSPPKLWRWDSLINFKRMSKKQRAALRANLNHALDRLEEEGLVECSRSKKSGRRRNVWLTKLGENEALRLMEADE